MALALTGVPNSESLNLGIEKMKTAHPIPDDSRAWLKEIAAAYGDAQEALPFGPLVGEQILEGDLFHLGPSVCLKFRGIRSSKSNLKRATDAALSSYVATREVAGELFGVPQMSFAFCYVASHLGLDLVSDEEASEILDHIEENLQTLVEMTENEQELRTMP